MKVFLFGLDVDKLLPMVEKYPTLSAVETDPDAIICYGGDGTLLSAEGLWPGIPKVPIRNSRRGHRCIAHPAADVIARLARGELMRTEFLKLECILRYKDQDERASRLTAMNEFNVHTGRVNTAVRFKVWVNDEAFGEGAEIIADGLVVCTPFGSTAYFKQITRGVFHTGLGIAFKFAAGQVNHLVASEDAEIRAVITRGPAVLGFDNSHEYYDLDEDDELVFRKDRQPAVLLTWDAMTHPSDRF